MPSLKIHATSVSAPELGEHATRWQVVVLLPDGTRHHYDRVLIAGPSRVIADAETKEPPHVYVQPCESASVIGVRADTRYLIQGSLGDPLTPVTG